jgi:RNA polymerase sigma-70 factor (ECF subfamily)
MIYEAAIDEDFPLAESDEVAALGRRDPAALAGLVERYRHRLYRYLLRLVKEPAAADDLFQQTWLNVVRQAGGFHASARFDTWLFSIAHNAAVDWLRRKSGESLDECEGRLAAAGPDALAAAISHERAEILAAEVGALPALYREALTLRFEEGMKLEEIATVTGVPLSTVKSRVQRALEGLRQRMAGRWRKEDLL